MELDSRITQISRAYIGKNNTGRNCIRLFIQNPIQYRDSTLKSLKYHIFYSSRSWALSPDFSFALVFGCPLGACVDKFQIKALKLSGFEEHLSLRKK